MPRDASMGLAASLNSTRPKKKMPVISSTVGVMRAAVPQPNFLKMTRDSNIMMKVTIPAAAAAAAAWATIAPQLITSSSCMPPNSPISLKQLNNASSSCMLLSSGAVN
jgi:hypothetical protein